MTAPNADSSDTTRSVVLLWGDLFEYVRRLSEPKHPSVVPGIPPTLTCCMLLSRLDQSLLLAAYFRGNTREQPRWTSCCDQIVTLSLFYTGEIDSEECVRRFETPKYVAELYDSQGELRAEVRERYNHLIRLVGAHPDLIEGGGDFDSPADPTFTACRLTTRGTNLAARLADEFPSKPDFPNWPDQRALP